MKFVVATAFCEATHYCELARTAESAGWDGVSVSDHVIYPERLESRYPYTPDGSPRFDASTPWPDPLVAIGAMAAVTERIQLLTNIYVLPLRNPFVVAKAVGTAAALSGDRVALGIGVGWMKEEFDLLEQDFKTRGRRTDEMIEVMRKLWTGDVVEHHGRFYDFDRLSMTPAPRGRISIYVGGVSDAAFRRIGRLADGWISEMHTSEELRRHVERIRAFRAEYGREGEPLDVVGTCIDAVDVDGYRRLEEMGVTHLLTQPWMLYSGPTADLEAKKAGLRRFADDVIAKMR
jgi:probable F420-dependent oxidoreductase